MPGQGSQCLGGTAGSEVRARGCGGWEEAGALPPMGCHVACFYFQGVWGDWLFLFVTHWSEVGAARAHLPCALVCCNETSLWVPLYGRAPGPAALSGSLGPRGEASPQAGRCRRLNPPTGVSLSRGPWEQAPRWPPCRHATVERALREASWGPSCDSFVLPLVFVTFFVEPRLMSAGCRVPSRPLPALAPACGPGGSCVYSQSTQLIGPCFVPDWGRHPVAAYHYGVSRSRVLMGRGQTRKGMVCLRWPQAVG